jgi:hypothetical protein
MNAATKTDIEDLRMELREVKSQLISQIIETNSKLEIRVIEMKTELLKWMLIFSMTQFVAISAMMYFIVKK